MNLGKRPQRVFGSIESAIRFAFYANILRGDELNHTRQGMDIMARHQCSGCNYIN
jgi:hypothetical protein